MKLAVIALIPIQALAWNWNATTIDPFQGGMPAFTYGSVYGAGQVRGLTEITILPNGQPVIGIGTIGNVPGVSTFNYYETAPGTGRSRYTTGDLLRDLNADYP